MADIIRAVLPTLEVVDVSKIVDIYLDVTVHQSYLSLSMPNAKRDDFTPIDEKDFEVTTSTEIQYQVMGKFASGAGKSKEETIKPLSMCLVLDAQGLDLDDPGFEVLSRVWIKDHPLYIGLDDKYKPKYEKQMAKIISSLDSEYAITLQKESGFDSAGQETVADVLATSMNVDSNSDLADQQLAKLSADREEAQDWLQGKISAKDRNLKPISIMSDEVRTYPTADSLYSSIGLEINLGVHLTRAEYLLNNVIDIVSNR